MKCWSGIPCPASFRASATMSRCLHSRILGHSQYPRKAWGIPPTGYPQSSPQPLIARPPSPPATRPLQDVRGPFLATFVGGSQLGTTSEPARLPELQRLFPTPRTPLLLLLPPPPPRARGLGYAVASRGPSPLALASRGWASGLIQTGPSEGEGSPGARGTGRGRQRDEGDEAEEGVASVRDGRGRNQRKRAAQAAKDYGLELIGLSNKQVANVIRWAQLPQETFEAVSLAKTLTRRGKNGWRRQVLYIGGLLRGISPAVLESAIHAAKEGSAFSDCNFDDPGTEDSASKDADRTVTEEIAVR